jgi:hypothetical protein
MGVSESRGGTLGIHWVGLGNYDTHDARRRVTHADQPRCRGTVKSSPAFWVGLFERNL